MTNPVDTAQDLLAQIRNRMGFTSLHSLDCATDEPTAKVTLGEIDRIRSSLTASEKLLRAVDSDAYGPICNDVDGKNWFDLRDELLKVKP